VGRRVSIISGLAPLSAKRCPGAPGCGNILKKSNIIGASTTPSPSVAGITPSTNSRLWGTGVGGLSHKTLAESSYNPRYRAELSPRRAWRYLPVVQAGKIVQEKGDDSRADFSMHSRIASTVRSHTSCLGSESETETPQNSLPPKSM
jgi:hypothetical protein